MTDVSFDEARVAICELLPSLTQMLRQQRDGSARAVGSWTVGDVAAHLSHVMERDHDSLTGRPLPAIELRPAAIADLTDEMLRADGERDPRALADRLDALGEAFVSVTPSRGLVTWIGETKISASAVACHLLLETLVHGYDIATAAGGSWEITAPHARLAIVGGALPIIAASPQSWIGSAHHGTTRARVELRLRGHDGFVLDLDQTLTVELPPRHRRADVHVSADPATLLLVMLGRRSPMRAMISGRVFAWGRRPTAAFTLMNNVSPP